MPNAYSTGPNPFIGAVDAATRLYGVRERAKLGNKQLKESARQHDDVMPVRRGELEDRKVRTGVLQQGNVIAEDRNAIARDRTDLDRDKLKAETPITEHNFGIDKVAMFNKALTVKGLDKPFKPLIDAMKGLAGDDKYTHREVFKHFKHNWGAYQSSLLESLVKDFEKERNPQRAEMLLETMKQINEDKDGMIVDMAMPATAELIANENMLLQPREGKQNTMKTWVLPDGSTVNLPNNQTPPDGAVPYSSGMEISTSDGTIIRTGVPGNMQRKTTGNVEEKLFNAQEGIARLNEIALSYKPEFLELGTKFSALNTKWQEIGKGTPIETGLQTLFGKATPENRKQLEELSAFRRDSINNINLYIKEITGAQMSEKEADRIRQGMPDPGEGLFDGDSPIQFESKWSSTMHSMRMSQARYIRLLNQGFNDAEIQKMAQTDSFKSLSSIKDEINARGDELKAEGKKGPEIKAILQQEFFTIKGQ